MNRLGGWIIDLGIAVIRLGTWIRKGKVRVIRSTTPPERTDA